MNFHMPPLLAAASLTCDDLGAPDGPEQEKNQYHGDCQTHCTFIQPRQAVPSCLSSSPWPGDRT